MVGRGAPSGENGQGLRLRNISLKEKVLVLSSCNTKREQNVANDLVNSTDHQNSLTGVCLSSSSFSNSTIS